MTKQALPKPRVLLLEDDALINMDTAQLLEGMGYAVQSYMHLEPCFAAVRNELPDAAVLDVNIAGATSYELADWLEKRRVPVIFLTGFELEDPLLRGRATCSKPCETALLRKLIADALTGERD